MPYSPTTWVQNSAPAINATRLNNIESGISKAPYGPDASNHFVPAADGAGGWTYKLLTNTEISAAAAIAYSKLNLALSIVNADISASAGIVYNKLNLAGSIVDADVATGTNLRKLSAVTGTPNGLKFFRDDGVWALPPYPGQELDYAQITSDVTGITATTEGTAAAVITGNSVTYDGTKNRIEIYMPAVGASVAPNVVTGVLLRDSTAIGQFVLSSTANTSDKPAPLIVAYDTPSAAAHTYSFKVFVDTGTGIIRAGAGSAGNKRPAHLRVTKA